MSYTIYYTMCSSSTKVRLPLYIRIQKERYSNIY